MMCPRQGKAGGHHPGSQQQPANHQITWALQQCGTSAVPTSQDEARRIRGQRGEVAGAVVKALSDHTALGGTMKHLTFGITLSSS
jgi:hypothetical protein